MRDEPKLLDGPLDAVSRALLESARGEVPPNDLRARLHAAVATTAIVPAVGTATAGAAKKITSWKLVALSAFVLVGVGIGVWATHRSSSAPSAPIAPGAPIVAPKATTATAPSVVASIDHASIAPAPIAPPEPTVTAPVASAVNKPAHAADSLHVDTPKPSELQELDDARAALAAHDPSRALELLHRRQVDYPNGTFTQEAFVLRIQALVEAGRTDQARNEAHAFLTKNPNGFYAKRVRSLIGE